MRLLILGGTRFLGPALADAALARGHSVSIFHRGEHPLEGRPEVERVLGDRSRDLSALRGRDFDAAVDTCGFVPSEVSLSASALADRAGLYVFVSSVSVYAPLPRPGMDESAPVAEVVETDLAEIEARRRTEGVSPALLGEHYGALKALCERAAEAAFSGRTLVVRPGLIAGPDDRSDRFTYWVRRIARGGTVLAPGRPARPVQLIDVRDLAEWIVRMAEERRTGHFNATGPGEPMPMGTLLESVREALGSDARFSWVPDEFLLQEGVAPWSELPLWIPESAEPRSSFLEISVARALASGLRFRPLAETARDTLVWDLTRAEGAPLLAGIGAVREAELLARFSAPAR